MLPPLHYHHRTTITTLYRHGTTIFRASAAYYVCATKFDFPATETPGVPGVLDFTTKVDFLAVEGPGVRGVHYHHHTTTTTLPLPYHHHITIMNHYHRPTTITSAPPLLFPAKFHLLSASRPLCRRRCIETALPIYILAYCAAPRRHDHRTGNTTFEIFARAAFGMIGVHF